jgi:hypothetical protein
MKIKLSKIKSVEIVKEKCLVLSIKRISIDGSDRIETTPFTSAELKKLRALLDEMDL